MADIIVTSGELRTLAEAQLRHAHKFTDEESIDHAFHSDDSYDYLKAALNLAAHLLSLAFDDNTTEAAKLFDVSNEDEFVFGNYACDGICKEVSDYLDQVNPNWEDEWIAGTEQQPAPAVG